jgi:hypothetical protein
MVKKRAHAKSLGRIWSNPPECVQTLIGIKAQQLSDGRMADGVHSKFHPDRTPGRTDFRKERIEMLRLIAVAGFALAVATSVQAMPLAPIHQPDSMITQARHACGAGMHWVNGVGCVTTPARRHVRREIIRRY